MIRLGVPDDATALAEFASRIFHETFAPDNRPEDVAAYVALAYGPAQQLRELTEPGIVTLIAEEHGEMAGYAQLRSDAIPACVTGDAPIELWRFYVAKAWHGRGVAQALMRRVQAEAVGCGARTLWLGVWERNERAKAFYRKLGFVDVGAQVFMLGTDEQVDRIMNIGLETPRVPRP